MLTRSDERVLAFLRELAAEQVTLGQIAEATGLPRVTIRTSLYALHWEARICLSQFASDYHSGRYIIRHLHPDSEEVPGEPDAP